MVVLLCMSVGPMWTMEMLAKPLCASPPRDILPQYKAEPMTTLVTLHVKLISTKLATKKLVHSELHQEKEDACYDTALNGRRAPPYTHKHVIIPITATGHTRDFTQLDSCTSQANPFEPQLVLLDSSQENKNTAPSSISPYFQIKNWGILLIYL